MFVRKFLIETFEESFLCFLGAEAADLVEGLPLGIEEVVEFDLSAIGVFDFLGQFALVVFDHLLLFLKLVGAAFEEILLLVEMAFAFEQFLPDFVELFFDAAFFFEGQFLGFDFGFLVSGGGLNFGLFDDLPGFFLGIVLAEVADQFDDAHTHAGGDEGDENNHPGIGTGLGVKQQKLRESENVGQHGRNSF